MNNTDYGKLAVCLLQTPEQKLAKTYRFLDMAKNGFNNTLAFGIDAFAIGAVELAAHGPELIVVSVDDNTASITSLCTAAFQGAGLKISATIHA